MQEHGARQRKAGRLSPRSEPEAFVPELTHLTRWSAGSISGNPVSGIGDMARGVLPERYWAAAEQAVYAVYSYETPILWMLDDRTWQMPNHRYSASTDRHRSTIVQALGLLGIRVEAI